MTARMSTVRSSSAATVAIVSRVYNFLSRIYNLIYIKYIVIDIDMMMIAKLECESE